MPRTGKAMVLEGNSVITTPLLSYLTTFSSPHATQYSPWLVFIDSTSFIEGVSSIFGAHVFEEVFH